MAYAFRFLVIAISPSPLRASCARIYLTIIQHCTSPASTVLIALPCFDVRSFLFFQLGLLALLLATLVQRTLPFVQRTFTSHLLYLA